MQTHGRSARSLRTAAVGALITLLLAVGTRASIENVRVVTTTATQAVIWYTPSGGVGCRVEVSESESMRPLVHDVDPALFPGSDLDTRQGTATLGSVRLFVVGRHGMSYSGSTNPFQAADGSIRSRALQAATGHYYRITCGADVVTGSFTTGNVPLGKTFGEPLPVGAPGKYNFPTLFNNRAQRIVDPNTGVLLRRVTLDGDQSNGQRIDWFSGAGMVACSPVQTDGGYLCQVNQEPDGYQNLLYWIDATTGESRYLGEVILPGVAGPDGWYQESIRDNPVWDGTDGRVFYHIHDGSRTPLAGSSTEHYTVVFKVRYTGDLSEVPQRTWAALSGQNLTPPSGGRGLEDQMAAFDPRYKPLLYRQAQRVGRQSHYLLFAVRRGSQDSYGFLVAYDLNTASVAGMMDVGHASTTRWCGIHGLGTGMPDVTWFGWGPQVLNQDHGGTGPWEATLGSAVTSTAQTTISVLGEPSCTATSGSCRGATGPSDTFMQNAEVGDLFRIGSEYVRLTAKTSATTWTIQRGVFESAPATYPGGSRLRATCGMTVNKYGQFANGFWNFAADPHAADTSNTTVVANTTMVGGHAFMNGAWWGMADYWLVPGSFPAVLTNPIAFKLSAEPPFAGAVAPAGGNSFMKHPTYHNGQAPEEGARAWFLDYQPFFGGNLHSDSPGVTLVTGSLYKYRPNRYFPIKPRVFDLFGASFKTPLKNVSGPSTVLTGTTADNYKFCVAERAGECAAGSAAGDVYVNVPNLSTLGCAGGDSSPTALDACIGNVPMYGHTLSQYGLRAGNVLAEGTFPTYGAQWSRTLVTLTGEYRMITPYATGKSFADGSWVMLPTRWNGFNPNGQVMIAKVPPYPASAPAVDMSTFVDAPVRVADPSSLFPKTSNVVCTIRVLGERQPRPVLLHAAKRGLREGCSAGHSVCVRGRGGRRCGVRFRLLGDAAGRARPAHVLPGGVPGLNQRRHRERPGRCPWCRRRPGTDPEHRPVAAPGRDRHQAVTSFLAGTNVLDKTVRVGVVVPTYNSSAVVGGALASISAQTYPNWTAVVVDDGSEDAGSVEALAGGIERVRYLPLPHGGAAAARNAGIECLDVDVIAFLDADDEWLPEFLERQVACLEAHPGWSAVYSDAYLVKDGTLLSRRYSDTSPSCGPVTFESLVAGTCNVITSGTLARRQALLDVGGFDPSLARAHDFDLWVRMVRRGHGIGYNLVPLVRYTISSRGLSGDRLGILDRECAILGHVSHYPDLNDSERHAVGAALATARSAREIEIGKRALAAGEYGAARGAFAKAWGHRPTAKTAAVRTLARLAPSVLRTLAGRRKA